MPKNATQPTVRRNSRKERLPILTGLTILAIGIVLAAGLWMLPEKPADREEASSGTRSSEATRLPDPSLRLSYMTAEEIKAQEILGILQDLESPVDERLDAIRELEMIDDELWEPVLIAAVQDQYKEVRIHAAELLANMPDEFAAQLLRVLLHDTDKEVREYASEIIAGLAPTYILEVYDPQNQEVEFEPDVIEEAVLALAEFDDKVAFEIILEMLNIVEGNIDGFTVSSDPNSTLRYEQLEDGSERVTTTVGIGMFVKKDAQGNVTLLEDSIDPVEKPYEYTREQIIEALYSYTDEDFSSFDQARIWWQGNIDPSVDFEVYNEFRSFVGSIDPELNLSEITPSSFDGVLNPEKLIIARVEELQQLAANYTGTNITFTTPEEAVTWFVGNGFIYDETMFFQQIDTQEVNIPEGGQQQ